VGLKLAFADGDAVIPEGGAPNETLIEAEPIVLAPLVVPNTLPVSDPLHGPPLAAKAIVVEGSLEPIFDLVDYYVFDGKAGQVVTIEVMSAVLEHRLDEFDAKLELLAMFGTPLAGIILSSIDGTAPTLIDFVLPFDGAYFIEIAPEGLLGAPGDYELLVYEFVAAPAPAALWLVATELLALAWLRRRSG
jgi:hypothetical protein